MRKVLPFLLLVIAFFAVVIALDISERKNQSTPDVHSNTGDFFDESSSEDEFITQQIEDASSEEASTDTPVSTNSGPQESRPSNESGVDVMPERVEAVISDTNIELTLVNRKYRIPENYSVPLSPAIPGSSVQLHALAAGQYSLMYEAAKREGCILTPYSGYRSYSRQKTNYENKTQQFINQGLSRDEALLRAATIIMPPGSSEHNLGLAMDICGTDYGFDKTKEFAWLSQNAENYGFILRYKQEKTHITKVVYEPWHWRYVGVENARLINQSGKCLEEYLGLNAG